MGVESPETQLLLFFFYFFLVTRPVCLRHMRNGTITEFLQRYMWLTRIGIMISKVRFLKKSCPHINLRISTCRFPFSGEQKLHSKRHLEFYYIIRKSIRCRSFSFGFEYDHKLAVSDFKNKTLSKEPILHTHTSHGKGT